MIGLRIVDRDSDHFIVTFTGPGRIEVSLLPMPGGAIIAHAYHGAEVQPDQDPAVVYDGSERAEMRDMLAYPVGEGVIGDASAGAGIPLTHGTYDPDDDSTKTPERGYGSAPFAVYILVVEDTNENAERVGEFASSVESVMDIPTEAQAIDLAREARAQIERLVQR